MDILTQIVQHIKERWKIGLIAFLGFLVAGSVWYLFVPTYLRWGFVGVALMAALYWWYPDIRKKVLWYGIPLSIFFFLSFFSKSFWGFVLALFALFVLFRESNTFEKTTFLRKWSWVPLTLLFIVIAWEPIRTHAVPKSMVITDYTREDTNGVYELSVTLPDGSKQTFVSLRFDLVAGLFDGAPLWGEFDGTPVKIWYKGKYRLQGFTKPEIFKARRLNRVECDTLDHGYYVQLDPDGKFVKFICIGDDGKAIMSAE